MSERLIHRSDEAELQKTFIEEWLVGHGVTPDLAGHTASRIEQFRSGHMREAFGVPPAVGIGARMSQHGVPSIWLFMPWQSTGVDELSEARAMSSVQVEFTDRVVMPLLPSVSVHLEFLQAERRAGDFMGNLRQICAEVGAECLGVLGT